MKATDIRDLVRFSEDEPRRSTLVDGEHLWSEIVCLQGSQGVGPLRDDRADGLLVVLAGTVATQVGKGRARMAQWETVEVPAGEDLTVRNASEEPAVLLLVVAPPPGLGIDPSAQDDQAEQERDHEARDARAKT